MSLIKQQILNSNMYQYKCPYNMSPIGICVHNTWNDASAKNEIKNMTKEENKKKISFHIAVDDVEAIQAIPFDRNTWHAGDGGSGDGNRKYISIEICYSKSGGDRFKNSEQRAAKVVAELLKRYGWGIDKVKAHRDFTSKDCPHRTNMSSFKKLVANELKSNSTQGSSSTIFENGDYSGKKARVTASSLNIRWDRGTNFEIVSKLKKDEIVKLQYCLNGWISIEGFKGNKGLGYVCTDYLELI